MKYYPAETLVELFCFIINFSGPVLIKSPHRDQNEAASNVAYVLYVRYDVSMHMSLGMRDITEGTLCTRGKYRDMSIIFTYVNRPNYRMAYLAYLAMTND